MEPAKLNSPDPADARLEALLREPASDVLPDDGFSQRVMAHLPDAELSRRAAIVPLGTDRPLVWSRSDLLGTGAAVAATLFLAQVSDATWAGANAALRQIEAAFFSLAEAGFDPSLLMTLGIVAGLLLLMSDDDAEQGLEQPND